MNDTVNINRISYQLIVTLLLIHTKKRTDALSLFCDWPVVHGVDHVTPCLSSGDGTAIRVCTLQQGDTAVSFLNKAFCQMVLVVLLSTWMKLSPQGIMCKFQQPLKGKKFNMWKNAKLYSHSPPASCQAPLLLQRISPAPGGLRVEIHPPSLLPPGEVYLQAHRRTASDLPPIMQLGTNESKQQGPKSGEQSYSRRSDSLSRAPLQSRTVPRYLYYSMYKCKQ